MPGEKNSNSIFSFIFLTLLSCVDSQNCYTETNRCYTDIELIDSVSSDTIDLKFSISKNKLFIIKDSYYSSIGILQELLFLDTDLGEGEVMVVERSKCYGTDCHLANPYKGHIIVMLEKTKNHYFFKHIVYDPLFNSLSYLDSSQIRTINQKPVISERYFELEITDQVIFKSYRNVKGYYQFSFGY